MPKKKPVAATPVIATAVICEKLLIEKDDVVSAIRIVDRLTVTDIPDDFVQEVDGKPVAALTGLKLLVMFKARGASGERHVLIETVLPSGRKIKSQEVTINFLPGTSGANVRADLPVFPKEEGIHWYLVKLDGKTLTRAPLEVVHGKSPSRDEDGSPEHPEGKD